METPLPWPSSARALVRLSTFARNDSTLLLAASAFAFAFAVCLSASDFTSSIFLSCLFSFSNSSSTAAGSIALEAGAVIVGSGGGGSPSSPIFLLTLLSKEKKRAKSSSNAFLSAFFSSALLISSSTSCTYRCSPLAILRECSSCPFACALKVPSLVFTASTFEDILSFSLSNFASLSPTSPAPFIAFDWLLISSLRERMSSPFALPLSMDCNFNSEAERERNWAA
mmetsp:Transcript_390/g.618  ORF Transcript_390/g.618 Transcript_390/m.618 type:complete len:226 (-) Transcript_390:2156-2833(-)